MLKLSIRRLRRPTRDGKSRSKERSRTDDISNEWQLVDASMINEMCEDGESAPGDGFILGFDDSTNSGSLVTTDSANLENETSPLETSPNQNHRFCFCPFEVDTSGGPHVCKGVCDKECEVFMANLVETIFSSSDKIDQETSATFDSYCKYSAGRRHFAELLNQRRIRDKLVEENTFYRLVQFFAICLFECHEAEDFTPATTLMNMCFTFYHNDATGVLPNNGTNDEDNSLSFLYTHLKDQHIWKSMRFWDVAFLTAMHQERTRWKHQHSPLVVSPLEIQEMDEMEENTTFGQLGTILHNMRELKIPKDECLKFLKKTSAIGNLKQDHFESLLAIVDQIEGRRESQERTSSSGSKVGKLFKNVLSVRKRSFKK